LTGYFLPFLKKGKKVSSLFEGDDPKNDEMRQLSSASSCLLRLRGIDISHFWLGSEKNKKTQHPGDPVNPVKE